MSHSTALADITFVAEHWPDLVETRIPGTARPWQPPTISAERREQLEHEARIERLERAEHAPGETPMPVHPDVLDVMLDVVEAADRLGEQVWNEARRPELPGPWRLRRFFAHSPARRWTPATSAYADPRAHLALMTERLDTYSALGEQVAREFRYLAQQVALCLRLLRDGQVLEADCPWCNQPRALVVHETEAGPLIVCQSRFVCEPPERDCGNWLRGRPCWPWSEWDWLAKRINHAERRAV